MKVTIFHIKSGVPKKYYNFYDKFVKFLQKKYPLKKDIKILFMGERDSKMSTGSNTRNYLIKVLTSGRLNRDILRTLSHEWVHEYQRQILKREKEKNIGGRNEDEVNASSGTLIKQFEKENPSDEQKMYNDDEKTARKSRKNSQSN
jgi:two-component SAPR family response regulator